MPVGTEVSQSNSWLYNGVLPTDKPGTKTCPKVVGSVLGTTSGPVAAAIENPRALNTALLLGGILALY